MSVWKLRGCPRCGGDIYIDRDLDSWYEQCLQCSYRRSFKLVDELKEEPTSVSRRKSEKQPVA